MRTELCQRLGIEFPIFAFTHCRDVVAAVSNAGGFGVLGAVGFTPEQLAIELDWIDAHVGDKPYGVDIVIPGKYEGQGEQLDPAELEAKLKALIPQGHRDFVKQILADHGVPDLPEEERPRELLGWTSATAAPQIETILKHEKVKLVANALGTPPSDVIAQIQESGRMVAALCGSVKHAKAHVAAGIDVVIAQGGEGGGHTGDVGSIVLWPEVIDAVAPTPVLAAGGVGNGRQMAAALAMERLLRATSRDTVRSRSWTGKPCRMLRNDWTEAWEQAETPDPLGMPLQFMVTSEAVARTHRYSKQAEDVHFNPVGQVVGQLNEVRSCREVIQGMAEEYLEAMERLEGLLPE